MQEVPHSGVGIHTEEFHPDHLKDPAMPEHPDAESVIFDFLNTFQRLTKISQFLRTYFSAASLPINLSRSEIVLSLKEISYFS